MAKSIRKALVVVAALAMLVVLAGTMAGTSSAANLTGGTYTYVVNGEETTFSFDPVIRKDGILLPAEVFGSLGLNVDGLTSKTITITKGTDVKAVLTVGTTSATLNDKPYLVATAPLRLSGRVFLPADILSQFGTDVSVDQNMVIVRNYAAGVDSAKTLSAGDYATLLHGRDFQGNPKADSNVFLTAEFTFLNPDLINTTNLGLSYGMRARLLTLLQTNTLVYTKLSNLVTKSGAMVTSSLWLVDSTGNQYELQSVMDIGNGNLTLRLAPGASRVGVLVFPKVQNSAGAVDLYYDNNGGKLGSFGALN